MDEESQSKQSLVSPCSRASRGAVIDLGTTAPRLQEDHLTIALWFSGVLLLLLATKIADQQLVIGGVIATVAWLSLYFGIVHTGYALLLLITAGLIPVCILAPRHLREASVRQ